MFCVYASVCFSKNVAPCEHWIQRGEINIALPKSNTLPLQRLNRHIQQSERELVSTESDSGLSGSVYTGPLCLIEDYKFKDSTVLTYF